VIDPEEEPSSGFRKICGKIIEAPMGILARVIEGAVGETKLAQNWQTRKEEDSSSLASVSRPHGGDEREASVD
jgi:hypothetical protein